MLKLVAIEPEKIAEVRNALTIISGNAHILFTLGLGTKKNLEEIIEQVNRIDKLLPQVAYKGNKND